MSEHRARLTWKRTTSDFEYDTYSRNHTLTLGSNQNLLCSSAAEYKGDATKTNPEELLVASASSCHMLTFLALAAKKRWIVDEYHDDPVGFLEKNEEGILAVNRITLRPRVTFSGARKPTEEEVRVLHQKAHQNCFIANSILAKVDVK